MQRGQVACYVFAFTRETKPNVAGATELLSRLESVNARAASKCCGLCAASFVCVIVSLSLPLQTIPSIVVLSFRVRRELVADVRIYSRDRYLESGHLMATVLLRETVLFCRFKYDEGKTHTQIKQN